MNALIGILVTLLAVAPDDSGRLPDQLDLKIVRSIPVQYDGRYMPLDTLARDVVETVTGDTFYKGRDPVLYLLAWTFDQQNGRKQPLIHLPNAELRAELQLPGAQTVFSYDQLLKHTPLLNLLEQIGAQPRGKSTPLETKVEQINKQLVTLQQIFTGRLIRPIPNADDPMGTWEAVRAPLPGTSESVKTVQELWQQMGQAFRANDA